MAAGGCLIGGFDVDDFAFINHVKNSRDWQSSGGYAFPSILDANGYPTSTPATAIFGVIDLPGAANYSGRWVIKWTGTMRTVWVANGGFTVHNGASFVVSNSGSTLTAGGTNGRIEFSFFGDPSSLTLTFPAAGTFSGAGGLALVRLEDEAAHDAGEYFLPAFLSEVRALAPSILRPMGWCHTNDYNSQARHQDRAPVGSLHFTTGYVPSLWVGTISGTDSYTCAAAADTPVSWTHLETFQGQITNANTSGTITIDVGGRGAKAVVTPYTGAFSVGEITANRLVTGVYDATLDKVLLTPYGLRRGIPIEYQVALANKIGADLWTNLPHLIDDASVTALATLVRNTLNSGLKFYVEYSNEVWNPGAAFPQTAYATAVGAALGFNSGNNRQYYGFYGKRVREIMGLVAAAWSPRASSELRRVLAFQSAGPSASTDTYRIQGADLAPWGYNTAPNRPVDYCDILSPATYIQGGQLKSSDSGYANTMTECLAAADNYASGSAALMSSALDWVDSDLRAGTRNGSIGTQTLNNMNDSIWSTWNAIAVTHGKRIIPYEGAMEVAAPSAARLTALGLDTAYAAKIANLILAYKNDHRFYVFVRDYARKQLAYSQFSAAAWFIIGGGDSQWSLRAGNLYAGHYKSWDALKHLNNGQRRIKINAA